MSETDQPAPLSPEGMVDYYHRRAPEYESIYHRDDPRRIAEREALAEALVSTLRGRRVLEVACGTGYWTARLAGCVRSLTGVDAAAGMLEQARDRGLPADRVELIQGDAQRLDEVPGTFDGGLAAFWVSHVERSNLAAFVDHLHARLEPQAAVFLTDSVFVPGLGGDLVDPGAGDTYKRRSLADGSEHLVLKNYYSSDELVRLLAPRSSELRIELGTHFWWAGYRVAG